ALLGPGTRNKGVALGDSNHHHEGIHEALANREVMAALMDVGVTHVCLEVTPEALKGFRDPSQHLGAVSGIPLADYFHYRRAPMARIVALCDAMGVDVVPIHKRADI